MIRVIDFSILYRVEGFKGYHKVISNEPIFNKCTLTVVDNRSHAFPKPVNDDYISKLIDNITEDYRAKIFRSSRAFYFRNKRDLSVIYSPIYVTLVPTICQ